MLIYKFKLKKKNLDHGMKEAFDDLRAQYNRLILIGFASLSMLVVSGYGGFLYRSDGMIAVFVILCFIAFFGLFAWFIALGTLEDRRHKVAFVERLARALSKEIAPQSRIKVILDGTHTQDSNKVFKTAESLMGNTKHYYKDKWLRLTCTLSDGTSVKLSGRKMVKTKKGAVLRDKRRIDFDLVPNPERYKPLSNATRESLRRHLKKAIRHCFHDPPEHLHVRLRQDSDHVMLKIEQWDAEILDTEIVAVLQAYVDFMDNHRKLAASTTSPAW